MPPKFRTLISFDPIWPCQKAIRPNDPNALWGLGVEEKDVGYQYIDMETSKTQRLRPTGSGRSLKIIGSASDREFILREFGPNVYPYPMPHLEYLLQCDGQVVQAYLASMDTKHVFSLVNNEEFCGYRCMQMISSCIVSQLDDKDSDGDTACNNQGDEVRPNGCDITNVGERKSLSKRVDPRSHPGAERNDSPEGHGKQGVDAARLSPNYASSSYERWSSQFFKRMPNILDIQNAITQGWQQGINADGLKKTGGLSGTRKWVGAIDTDTFFRSRDVKCELCRDYPQRLEGGDPVGSLDQLIEELKTYFGVSDGPAAEADQRICKTGLPPLYLQTLGHSVVIVGMEKRKVGRTAARRRWKRLLSNLTSGSSKGRPQAKWSLLVLDPASKGNEYQAKRLELIRSIRSRESKADVLAEEARRLLAAFRC